MSEPPALVVERVAAAMWADAYKRPFDEFARASETVRAAYFSIARVGIAEFLAILKERELRVVRADDLAALWDFAHSRFYGLADGPDWQHVGRAVGKMQVMPLAELLEPSRDP